MGIRDVIFIGLCERRGKSAEAAGLVVMYEGLRKLRGMLAGRVSAAVVDEFVGFLNAGEPDVGLEWLCDYLFDWEIPLSRAEVDLISVEGAQMRLTRASVLRIGELLSAD